MTQITMTALATYFSRRNRSWWTYGDERYFRVINGSSNTNARIDMSLLYDRYYDRAETISEIAVNLEVSQRTAEVNSNVSTYFSKQWFHDK